MRRQRRPSRTHKISQADANLIATVLAAVVDSAPQGSPALPLSYVLACLAIESAFDPKAENSNQMGSNKAGEPGGYDVGIAQLKLRYLAIELGSSIEDARLFALDPTRAIPHFAGLMQGHLQWWATAFQHSKLPSLRNKYYAATMTYNFGREGLLNHLIADDFPKNALGETHGDIVVQLERRFANQLNTTSVFDDI